MPDPCDVKTNKHGQEEIKMIEQKKKPETTVKTLDLGQNCLLTLTTRHLRGQVLRIIEEPGQPPRQIKDQVDVLLSGLSGYSVEEINMSSIRIRSRIGGIGLSILGVLMLGFDVLPTFVGVIMLLIGIIKVILSMKYPEDRAIFTLNVMGSKIQIPVAYTQVKVCRNFITKLQETKTEYEEASLL